MPSRRVSTPGSPVFFSSPSARSRGASGMETSQSMGDFGSASRADPAGAAGSGATVGEQRIVNAFIQRLQNKLPCNSGMRLAALEVDPGVQQTVASLVQMSKIRLSLVVQGLVQALETVSKYSSSTSLHDTPIDTVHSQIYLLYILNACLSASWRHHSTLAPPRPADVPRCWPDPPPFDDALARHLLSTVIVYAHMFSGDAAALVAAPSPVPSKEGKGRDRDRETGTPWSKHLAQSSTAQYLGTEHFRNHSYPGASQAVLKPPEPLALNCASISSSITQMTKLVAQIVFFLSASNWPLILTRLKTRIAHLTTTIEDAPDLVELRLLEWANVDRARLAQAVQEVSSTFLHIKRPAQVAVALVIRKCIWNWIEAYPGEFEALVESNRKIDPGTDVLFDVLYAAADLGSSSNVKRTRVFYPLMATLLVITPDTFKRAIMGDMATGRSSSGVAKKVSFLESLRKGITSTKAFEPCAAAYTDFFRAGMALPPRLESAGVKSLIPDISSDLRNTLFSSSMMSDLADPDLPVDALVAFYRGAGPGVGGATLTKLFAESDVHKLLAVKACLAIVTDGQRLPWYPPISDLWRDAAGYIKTLLKFQAAGIVGDRGDPRKPRAGLDVHIPEVISDMILASLQLLALDPAFSLSGGPADATPEGLTSVFLTLSSFTIGPSPEVIRIQAAKTIVALVDHLVSAAKLTESVMAAAESAASAIWACSLDLGRQVAHDFTVLDFEGLAASAESLKQAVFAILRLSEIVPTALASSPNALPAAMMAGTATLLAFLGLNVRSSTTTIPMARALYQLNILALQPTLAKLESDNSPAALKTAREIKTRLGFYQDLGNLPPALGRQHFQRQFRNVIRKVSLATPTSLGCWYALSGTTKLLTTKIAAASTTANGHDGRRRGLTGDIEGLDDEQSRFWQDSIPVLACIAGLCIADGSNAPINLTDVIGKGTLPQVFEATVDPPASAEAFIRDCVDLLVSGSVTVRETVKEALGAELPPALGRFLVVQLDKGSAGIKVSETFTVLVDQAVSILRAIIDRMSPSESNVQVDMGDLLFTLAQYTHRLGRDDNSIRLKTRFCLLVEAVLQKPESVSLSNGPRLQGALLDWVCEWTGDGNRETEAYHLVMDTSVKAQRDLELAALKLLVPLTNGLTLRSPGEESEAQGVAKSRLFYRYYLHLVRVLERGINSSGESESFHPTRSISNQATERVPPEDTSSLAVDALSNLLSANIDVGLKHCLSLGYHEDPTLRTAFMQLLITILQQGARFGGLNAKRLSSSSRLFLDLLTGDNMALAVAVVEACPPSEVDEISLLLFRAFEERGTMLSFVKLLVEREVNHTSHESDLFRANTITTRILTVYAKTYGYNYVRATLQPLVLSLVEKPEQCSFELDPAKATFGEDIDRNADHLKLMCQALLDLISSSTPRVPIMLRAVCHHIWEVVEDKFPDSRHSAVGSFIFLRFFCPAIVAPENIDLDVTPDTREVRRALLLITKVIQNLANNVVFGNKEPHMKVLNTFLSDNIRQVTKFLSDIAIRPRSWETSQASKGFQEEAERGQDPDGDEAVLNHTAKLETSLESMPTSYRANSTRPSKSDLDGRAALGRLRQVVEQRGTAGEGGKLSASVQKQIYDDFMRQHQGRNTESVQQAFYEGPTSQNGRRIFYFIVSRVGLIDYDLLGYRIFETLDKITDFFDLVIDLTDFSPSNELPVSWLRRCLQMCPAGILPCLNTLALYNPNTYARKRIRRLVSELVSTSGPIGKSVVAVSSPSELAEYIPFSSLALSEYTMELAFEADHVFTNLLCLSDHEMQVPVVVKLGHACLQIASWRKQDLTPTIKAYIIDVIRLEDMDDLIYGTGLASDHLIIKHRQGETVTFISRKRNEMAQIIRAARAKIRDAPSQERALRPSDVPGTLLNIALLNLSSHDEVLRLGAYNLINELSSFLKYDIASRLSKVSSGLTIPSNSLTFTNELSKTLAASAPQLTLELLREWAIGYSRTVSSSKAACLQYVSPWLANLDGFSKPSREDAPEVLKEITEIIRAFISVTVAERSTMHLAIQERVWMPLANASPPLTDIMIHELLHVGIDAGLGSEKAECVGNIMVSIASTTVRGRVIARLRKTYLRPTATLADSNAWNEICVLARLVTLLSFNPPPIDLQLFLPEVCHIICILLGTGPVLMRQTVYGLLINVLQALSSATPSGEMDRGALEELLCKAQGKETVGCFGLRVDAGSLELHSASAPLTEGDGTMKLLSNVEAVAHLLGELLSAAAISIDCCNAWRARWMSLVAATCFQHNPATQPQALTVLGYLASDEVDDDLVYQIFVAMSTTLSHLTDTDNILVTAMLRCLTRIIPGLASDSRYFHSLFWLAIRILQLSWIPFFSSALELLLTCLRALSADMFHQILDLDGETRRVSGDAARKLDMIFGINFEAEPHFSLAATVFKGVRHPSTRKAAIECLTELLRLSSPPSGSKDAAAIGSKSLAYFMCLYPLLAGTPELQAVFVAAGLDVSAESLKDVGSLSIFDLLNIPDNSTALLLVTLATTILQSASSENEKLAIYRFLAEAASEIPEVVSMTYDSLIPRMTAVLASTSNTAILGAVSTILERAMSDPSYTFPSPMYPSESSSSLHQKSYSASISSAPSVFGAGTKGDGVLEEMGMKGLVDLSFPPGRMERVAPRAKWVAVLIENFTV